ncbi:hypothetical protein [Methanolobus sp.]|uniref:hypothetical protein n=1 Tax=Methanolobus sp. TaxID=1874737 RepID=UPI0025ECC8CE|nr:hypothetical protein [Methanolobus sp.]
MSSLNWSKNSKPSAKSRPNPDFTPNIYRKPVINEESRDKDSDSHTPESPGIYNQKTIVKTLEFDLEQLREQYEAQIKEYREKEAVLTDVKERYNSQMKEYEEKQKHLEALKEDMSRQEELLGRKCTILKSVVLKAEESIPAAQVKELEEKRSVFEKDKAEFERQVEEFETSQKDYEQRFALLENKNTELSCLMSSYEEGMQEYLDKQKELEEKAHSLEEQLASGNDLSMNIEGLNCGTAIDLVKSRYYSELKELNRKRADLGTLREELENEESLLNAKSSSIMEIKEQVQSEFSRLIPQTAELEAAMEAHDNMVRVHEENERTLAQLTQKYDADYALFRQQQHELEEFLTEQAKKEYALGKRKLAAYESRKLVDIEIARINSRSVEFQEKVCAFEKDIEVYQQNILEYEENLRIYTENNNKLQASTSLYEEEFRSFEERRAALEEQKLSISYEEDVIKQKQSEIDSNKSKLESEETKIVSWRSEIESEKASLESELENIRLKREDTSKLESDLESGFNELESRRRELEDLLGTTEKEIGAHITLHRQHLDIRKVNTRLEQQSVYIKSLEDSLKEMQRTLEDAMSDARKQEMFSHILKMNMELSG